MADVWKTPWAQAELLPVLGVCPPLSVGGSEHTLCDSAATRGHQVRSYLQIPVFRDLFFHGILLFFFFNEIL